MPQTDWEQLLDLCFTKQLQFAKQQGVKLGKNENVDADITKECLIGATEELIKEAMAHLPNRRLYRKDGPAFEDKLGLAEELADAMLFIIAAAIWSGTHYYLMPTLLEKASTNLSRSDHGRQT